MKVESLALTQKTDEADEIKVCHSRVVVLVFIDPVSLPFRLKPRLRVCGSC